MIVVSLDPTTETASMVSIPRDLVDVPLPNGKRFSGKINGLVSYARRHKAQFPGSNGQGVDVLMAALGELLKVKIDYYALVNLGGFIPVVDKLGGVDVHVDNSFCDPSYDEYGFTAGFSIKAGWRHLNGKQALAYARVRKAAGESDFTRAARQQEVLSGIRDRLVNGGFLEDPIGLLKSVSRTVQTNVPRSMVPDLVAWGQQVDRGSTYREVVSRPLVRGALELPGRGSIQIPNIAGIRALAERLFTEPGTVPAARYKAPAAKSGKATTKGVGSCAPARTPRPTPKPTKKPTPKPAATAKPTDKPPDPTAPPDPTTPPDPTPEP
jgi:LCP family protein required for cell wall assembly